EFLFDPGGQRVEKTTGSFDAASELRDLPIRTIARLTQGIGQLFEESPNLPLRVLLCPNDLGQRRTPGGCSRGIGAERSLDRADASDVGHAKGLGDRVAARLTRQRRALDGG